MNNKRLASVLMTIIGQRNWEQQLKELAHANDMRYLDRLAQVDRMPRAVSACEHRTIAGHVITRGPQLFLEYPADYTPNKCWRCCHYDIENGCRVNETGEDCTTQKIISDAELYTTSTCADSSCNYCHLAAGEITGCTIGDCPYHVSAEELPFN